MLGLLLRKCRTHAGTIGVETGFVICKCSAILSMNKRTALSAVDHESALELLLQVSIGCLHVCYVVSKWKCCCLPKVFVLLSLLLLLLLLVLISLVWSINCLVRCIFYLPFFATCDFLRKRVACGKRSAVFVLTAIPLNTPFGRKIQKGGCKPTCNALGGIVIFAGYFPLQTCFRNVIGPALSEWKKTKRRTYKAREKPSRPSLYLPNKKKRKKRQDIALLSRGHKQEGRGKGGGGDDGGCRGEGVVWE